MSRLPGVLLVVLVLATAGRAAAAPLSARVPEPGASVVAALGVPETSVTLWSERSLGLVIRWRHPAASAGAAVAWRGVILGGARGWGLDAVIAAGPTVPLRDPGLALSLSPAVLFGHRGGRWRLTAGLSSDAALRLGGGFDARLPLTLETHLGVALGPAMVGLGAGAGVVLAPGQRYALEGHLALVLGWRPD